MAIHNCTYTFSEMSRHVLPEYMTTLRLKMKDTVPAMKFCERGVGYKTLLKVECSNQDFSGCYVFIEQGKPLYVGISQTVIQRLRTHVNARNHFDSSLVYAIANKIQPIQAYRKTPSDERYVSTFTKARDRLRNCNVAYITIENPLVLYIFEAYAAMELDTSEWNSFITH